MKRIFYPALNLIFFALAAITATGQGINNLWGITTSGGSENLGAIFKADGDGANAMGMHSFTSSNPGATPMYNQLTEYNGKFYAMTLAGGSNNLGVIFEWDPATNIYTKKYDFNGTDGGNPHGNLTLVSNKFYGMTRTGGNYNLGVIFEWDPATNTYTNKHDFDGPTGSGPYGSLAEMGGKLYGMTNAGGYNSKGVIFEWDPATNTYTKKYDFDVTNGSFPYGHLSIYSGKFYGMTTNGGTGDSGVIFEWDAATNTFTKKFDFGSAAHLGANPYGSLTLEGGKFYGMTKSGGSSDGKGAIFEWDPATNIYTKKFAFGGGYTSGDDPYGNLVYENGKFYGMTSIRGYSRYTEGALFEWDPVTNVYTVKYDYRRVAAEHRSYNGASPFGSLVVKAGKLYGMTSGGGDNKKGVIFEFDPVASTYTKKINFIASVDGKLPESGLSYDGTNIHGLTKQGGTEGLGTIFEWNLAAGQFIKKYDFNPATGNGRVPNGTMLLVGGKYYGLGFYYDVSPSTILQNIFEWDPATNIYTAKASLSGHTPVGNLVESGGKLYCLYSGTSGGTDGGLLRYDPVLNTVVRLFTFDNVSGTLDGVRPLGGLIDVGGKLYGMTSAGGTNNRGVLFAWDIAAGTMTKKYDFSLAQGSTPVGTLILDNGKLYGTTQSGGAAGQGVLFEWDPATNTYAKKYDFSAATGSNPNGFLVQNNGKFYGLTSAGGDNGLGVIFEWDPATDTYTKKSDFDGSNGRIPDQKNNLVIVPAPVARGLAGSCTTLPEITIANANNSDWVPLIDNDGNAVGEIKANGNNLGAITTTVYINNTTVREDGGKHLYSDRNITITPEHQPTSPVDIRLYVLASEFEALKNATNSNGSASGITTVNDISIFKNDDACGTAVVKNAARVATTAAPWGTDYVLSGTVTKFSTFYFASSANVVLPLAFLDFSGTLQGNQAELNWKTEYESNTLAFIIEKSIDGGPYKEVGTVAAVNMPGIQAYHFTDPQVNMPGAKSIYYRLKQKDIDGHIVYSKTVTFVLDKLNNLIVLYPNPVMNNELRFIIQSPQTDMIKWQIVDATGRIINNQTKQITAGTTSISLDVTKIAKGIYFLNVESKAGNRKLQFVKP